MNMKLVAGIVIVFLIIGIATFAVFLIKGTGHEEETSWGSWYQEYTAYYTDGGSSSLSIFHDEREVDYIEYVLQATVDPGFSSVDVVFDLSDYKIRIKQDDMVLDTLVFSESKTVGSDDGQVIVLTDRINSSVFDSLDIGTYTVSFVPDGSILINDEETSLPSGASAFIQVDTDEEHDIVVHFESEIEYY